MPKYKSFADAPLEVRKRYFQIKFSPYLMAIMRRYIRLQLNIKERKNNKVLTNTLYTYKIEAIRARSKGNECIQVLMNIGLYYLIAEKDIQAVKIDALTHSDPWKRQLALRVILLTIYEWDMGKASSSNLKQLLINSSVDEELQRDLYSALKKLRKSQKEAAKLLRFERNATIAHRDSDALLQLNTIQYLSPKKVFDAASGFYDSSKDFMQVFPKVMMQAGSLEGLFSFMLKNRT